MKNWSSALFDKRGSSWSSEHLWLSWLLNITQKFWKKYRWWSDSIVFTSLVKLVKCTVSKQSTFSKHWIEDNKNKQFAHQDKPPYHISMSEQLSRIIDLFIASKLSMWLLDFIEHYVQRDIEKKFHIFAEGKTYITHETQKNTTRKRVWFAVRLVLPVDSNWLIFIWTDMKKISHVKRDALWFWFVCFVKCRKLFRGQMKGFRFNLHF